MMIHLISEMTPLRFGVATLTAQTVNGPKTIDLRANRNPRRNLTRQMVSQSRFVTLPSGIQQLTF